MSKKPTCIMCGCQDFDACSHPDYGSCHWESEDPWICSHCIWCPGEGEGSGNYCENNFIPTSRAIKQWLAFQNINASVTTNRARKEELIIGLSGGNRASFIPVLKMIFPNLINVGGHTAVVRLTNYKMRVK